jgi:hypothetical protein
MLQRIQTVYLTIAVVLLGLLFALPFAATVSAQSGYAVLRCTSFPLVLIQALAFAMVLATIFLYKRRALQMRLCTLGAILLVGYQPLLPLLAWASAATVQPMLPMAFPIVAALLTFMARRSIARDEALVRSFDRLR